MTTILSQNIKITMTITPSENVNTIRNQIKNKPSEKQTKQVTNQKR